MHSMEDVSGSYPCTAWRKHLVAAHSMEDVSGSYPCTAWRKHLVAAHSMEELLVAANSMVMEETTSMVAVYAYSIVLAESPQTVGYLKSVSWATNNK